jgi:hypothetical protein
MLAVLDLRNSQPIYGRPGQLAYRHESQRTAPWRTEPNNSQLSAGAPQSLSDILASPFSEVQRRLETHACLPGFPTPLCRFHSVGRASGGCAPRLFAGPSRSISGGNFMRTVRAALPLDPPRVFLRLASSHSLHSRSSRAGSRPPSTSRTALCATAATGLLRGAEEEA